MLLNVHEAFYIMIPCIRAPGEDMTRVFSYAHQSCGCRGGFSFRAGGQVHLERYVAEVGAGEPFMNRAPAVESFYVSWIWRKCRRAFAESKGNLCERCLKRGIIEPGSKDRPLEVHHKTPLTADNVQDPEISLNWEQLELLCKTCHDEERERKTKRWKIDKNGKVVV